MTRYTMRYQTLIEDYNEFREPVRRPRYFIIIKYFLVGYIFFHLLWLIATLPIGLQDLRHEEHQHTDEIHAVWVISILYSFVFSVIGLVGILRENFILCFIFAISMVINLLLLVYGTVLHRTQTTGMIVALITNWFFTCVVIAFTKLVDSLERPRGSELLESTPGFLHSIYIRPERPPEGDLKEPPEA